MHFLENDNTALIWGEMPYIALHFSIFRIIVAELSLKMHGYPQ